MFTNRSVLGRAALTAAIAIVSTSLVVGPPAAGDTAPPDPSSPSSPITVAADGLPTAQVNGVVWNQAIIGNTVYAVGSFTRARPAGAAPGTQEVVRNNAMAYDIRTGQMTSWAPDLNAQALAVAASPDGSRVYLGGDFTTVGGVARSRVVAVDPTSGTTIGSFTSRTDAKVRALVATDSTLYVGGLFSNANGVTRSRVAALRVSDGAVTAFAPVVAGGGIWAMTLTPDRTRLVLGGNFTSVNGSSRPGYGLAAVDAATGASRPWAVNGVVRNGGANAAITGLSSDGDSVYGTGYVFGSGGNFEGTFRARGVDGAVSWLADCHGDSYGVFPRGDDVYVVSHAHYCNNLPSGFPEGEARRATAFSKAATGLLKPNAVGGYANFAGQPAPSLLHFFPDVRNGTFTGQGQGAWSVTGNSDYVVLGGEFPTVNGAAQQGLVRLAASSIAPNKSGGVLTQSKLNPTLTALGGGAVRLEWPSNWDRDNRRMTYRVIRDGNVATPRYQVQLDSTFWQLPRQRFDDTGLVPGQTYRYRVFSQDPFGNETRSDTVTVVAR